MSLDAVFVTIIYKIFIFLAQTLIISLYQYDNYNWRQFKDTFHNLGL